MFYYSTEYVIEFVEFSEHHNNNNNNIDDISKPQASSTSETPKYILYVRVLWFKKNYNF